jgi:predicted phage terminase large subunit-like protein
MNIKVEDLIVTDVAVKRLLLKSSFYEFFKFYWDVINHEPLVDNWHIKYLCDELQIVAERVFKREKKLYDLIINIPPSTSKTSIVNIFFPLWCWVNDYSLQFISVSYSYQLSINISERCRDVMRSDLFKKYFFDVKIKEDSDTKQLFRVVKDNQVGGFRYATSVGGTISGIHGHFILLDDPVNAVDSLSDTMIRNTNDWLDNVIFSRKVDNDVSVVILIMQRLHENDPAGYLLSKNKNIKHICLPALQSDKISPPDLKKNYIIDGLLDGKRLSKEILEQKRIEMGDYAFAMQYMQEIVPKAGSFFDVSKLLTINNIDEKEIIRKVRYWDKAGTHQAGCYTVGVKMAMLKNRTYAVLDVVRGQWEASEREKIIRQVAELDGQQVTVFIEQEPGSGGKESAESTIRNLAGFRCIADRPTGDKISRADTLAVQLNAGNVSMLRAEWNNEFKREFEFFPYGKFKDQVDATSGAFNMLVKMGVGLASRGGGVNAF